MTKKDIKEKKFLVSKDDILSLFAKHAVGASPYHRPDNLETVLDQLNKIIEPFFKNASLGFKKMKYRDIIDFVLSNGEKIPEFKKWNDRKNGRDGHGASDRYSKASPDDDFIDLHALSQNVANDVLFSQYDSHSIPDILEGKAKHKNED